MANIKPYTDQIQNAVYGEEVRSSIINALNKVNDDNEAYQELNGSIASANATKEELDASVVVANTVKGNLETATTAGNIAKNNLDASVATANGVLSSLTAENTSAASNLEQLQSENFNSQEILAGVADVRAYLGLADADILGVQVDYKNKTFTRIAGATNLTGGADFNPFPMFGGRKRCNVSDDGTINAYYGDEGYVEDGSMGQVMVYQPKFYYLVCPVVYDPIETGIGYHLRKANYYVSSKARAGFRLHPAFYDASGNPVDYILLSAYEGSLWDADGGEGGLGAYILDDAQVMDNTADKFCSIAGAKPASGLTQDLARPKIEQMAQNRGTGWHGDLIKAESANQLLMIIEMGKMDLQTAIGQGVVSIVDNTAYNCSSLTGSTSSLGNATGSAASTVNEIGGTQTTYNTAGKVSITYRGMENPWGNIYKFVRGVNVYGNGNMGGGQPYICSNFAFAESKNNDNYVGAGFTLADAAGYVSAMGYSTGCDWLFMPSETLGTSALPVGDYAYVTPSLNGYRIAYLGGGWSDGDYVGGFCWAAHSSVGARRRGLGGRLVYVPTATV